MKIPYLKIIVPIYIVLGYLYIIFSGVAKEQSVAEIETRKIYNLILKEIHNMGGEYRQYGGQVIWGFILEADFSGSSNYDVMRIVERINELGFKVKMIEKNNFYLFCKEKKGVWLTKKPILNIRYDRELSDCMK